MGNPEKTKSPANAAVRRALYFHEHRDVGVELLAALRDANPKATPREIWKLLSSDFIAAARNEADSYLREELHREFTLTALVLQESGKLTEEMQIECIRLLESVASKQKRKTNTKRALMGGAAALEAGVELLPFLEHVKWFKNAKWLTNTKKLQKVQGAGRAVAGAAGVAGVAIGRSEDEISKFVGEIRDRLGPTPTAWENKA